MLRTGSHFVSCHVPLLTSTTSSTQPQVEFECQNVSEASFFVYIAYIKDYLKSPMSDIMFFSLRKTNPSYWSALASAPTSASAGAKEASNSTEVCFVVVSTTIELPLPGNLGS